jgi:LPPG:FO 2-phospho-L-lactate transferase
VVANKLTDEKYVVLAGGVGAAKFIEGLAHTINSENLKIIINTGDDIELFGLHICPDIDIITYTLANLVDKEKGWGFKEETFNCLSILKKYYKQDWFNAGDKDLATHIYRTDLFKNGMTKSEITRKICRKLGVKAELIPMCNQTFKTFIKTPEGVMHFEEYYIKHQCKPKILDVIFKGRENVQPTPGILKSFSAANKIIICPSNPIVSIGTILSIPRIKASLRSVKEKVYGISPIIEGTTVKGPADKLMKWNDLEVSSFGVAKFYQDILGHFIIDIKDKHLKPRIEELGIKTYCYDTLMVNLEKKKRLAEFVLRI